MIVSYIFYFSTFGAFVHSPFSLKKENRNEKRDKNLKKCILLLKKNKSISKK
jgi:hypothetical protein